MNIYVYIVHKKTSTQNLACSQHHVQPNTLSLSHSYMLAAHPAQRTLTRNSYTQAAHPAQWMLTQNSYTQAPIRSNGCSLRIPTPKHPSSPTDAHSEFLHPSSPSGPTDAHSEFLHASSPSGPTDAHSEFLHPSSSFKPNRHSLSHSYMLAAPSVEWYKIYMSHSHTLKLKGDTSKSQPRCKQWDRPTHPFQESGSNLRAFGVQSDGDGAGFWEGGHRLANVLNGTSVILEPKTNITDPHTLDTKT